MSPVNLVQSCWVRLAQKTIRTNLSGTGDHQNIHNLFTTRPSLSWPSLVSASSYHIAGRRFLRALVCSHRLIPFLNSRLILLLLSAILTLAPSKTPNKGWIPPQSDHYVTVLAKAQGACSHQQTAHCSSLNGHQGHWQCLDHLDKLFTCLQMIWLLGITLVRTKWPQVQYQVTA